MALSDKVKFIRERMDGWMNVLTGLGTRAKDKSQSAFVLWSPVNEVDIEELYAADDMAAKIVDKVVDECLRNGWNWSGIEQAQADKLTQLWNEKGLTEQFNHAWKTARMHGGSGLFLVTQDLGSLDQPISENPIINSTTVLSRWELWIDLNSVQRDISKPDYMKPMYYTLQPRATPDTNNVGVRIDASRVIRFDGIWLTNRLLVQNQYWGDSHLNRPYQKIRNYSATHDAVATIVQDFSISVFKIKNLADMVSADDDSKIIGRMQMVSLAKSMINSVVIDAEGEDFDHKARSVSGLADLVKMVEDRLVASTPMPHTVLFGHSPATAGVGSSTGESEETNWYDYLKAEQVNYLKPKIVQAAKMLAFELKMDLSKLDAVFNPIERSDPSEEANIRFLTAQTDQIYLNNSVVDAIEVGMSRFGGDQYSTETEIDTKLRKQLPNLADDAAAAEKAREVYQNNPNQDPDQKPGEKPALPGQKQDRKDSRRNRTPKK